MSIFDVFDKLATTTSNKKGCVDYIIVGLGNPGMQYEDTRHNVGFMTLDLLAKNMNTKIDRMKFKGLYADVQISNKRCIILKPTTYMNNSGESVVDALNFYKLDTSRLIVIYDDISLEPSKIRIRRRGSHGGHNGIKSIIELTGKDDFPRIKIGVGKKPHPDYDLAKWVLSKFKDEDKIKVDIAISNACDSIKLLVDDNITEAMNKYNS